MSISASTLFNGIAQDFGVGVGSDRLKEGFVRAVNRSLDELSLQADLATRLAHIQNVDDSISLDNQYEWIVYSGVVNWLWKMGYKTADPRIAAVVLNDVRKSWEDAKDAYVVAEDNDLQSDEDNDIGLWGNVED